MSTTTIRLPEALKARIDKLAAARGGTAHGFMVEALAQAADLSERQQAFDAEAQRRWKRIQRTGEYHTLEDLRAYATALARGEQVTRPPPRKMTPEELSRLRASARRTGGA